MLNSRYGLLVEFVSLLFLGLLYFLQRASLDVLATLTVGNLASVVLGFGFGIWYYQERVHSHGEERLSKGLAVLYILVIAGFYYPTVTGITLICMGIVTSTLFFAFD